MKVLLIALAVLTVPAAAAAQEWDRRKNIDSAAINMLKEYKENGVIGLGASIKKCYPEDKQPKKLEYCIAYDAAAYKFLHNLQRMNGFPLEEEFYLETHIIRVLNGFDKIGVKPALQGVAFGYIQEMVAAVIEDPAITKSIMRGK